MAFQSFHECSRLAPVIAAKAAIQVFPRPPLDSGSRVLGRNDGLMETYQDINYLAQYAGEDHLVTGSDYGHNDPAEQTHLVTQMRAREDVPGALVFRFRDVSVGIDYTGHL